MSSDPAAHPLHFCLAISRAHASLNLKLDDELGTFHGLAFADFSLLQLLSLGGGRLPVAELVRPLGMRLSAVTRQLVTLEKTGLVQRETDAGGRREAVLRPAGRALLQAATQTAEAVCADALRSLGAAPVGAMGEALAALSRSPALAL